MRLNAYSLVAAILPTIGVAACDPQPAPPTSTRPASSTAAATAQPSGSVPASAAVPAPPPRPAGPQLIEEKDYTGVILPVDYPWSRGKKRWRVDKVGVAEAEYCIARELTKMKVTPAYQANQVPQIAKQLKEYRRQYMGYTDDQGVDLVWVNFFLDPKGTHADWKTELVTVRGGGHAYFNVTADVAGGTCGDLQINSPR